MNDLTEEELREYQSIRYRYNPVLVVPLSSGRIAVSIDRNPFPPAFVCLAPDLGDHLTLIALQQQMRYEERRRQEAERQPLLTDLSFLDLGDL